MSGIYKWTSPSGKSYIGQAINLKKRYGEFKRPNSAYTSKGSAIDKARKKYNNFDEWDYEILEECSIESLDVKEKYWIDFYNTKVDGYNSTNGGDGNKGWKPSEEQTKHLQECQAIARNNGAYEKWYTSDRLKQITSEKFKGRIWSEEQRKKISNSLKGNKLSKETCDKMRTAMKKKFQDGWQNYNRIKAISKKVAQYSIDGEFIKEYSSISEASVEFGRRKDDKNIRKVLQGKQEMALGYVWKYAA